MYIPLKLLNIIARFNPTWAFILCLTLTSCVHYLNTNPQSHPLSSAHLAIHHHYPMPSKLAKLQGNWWEHFHDPQLNQLIAVALSDSPDILIAESRVRGAQAVVEGAISPLFPSVNFKGWVGEHHFSETSIIPPPYAGTNRDFGIAALNFNYELDFWGKNRETLAARCSEKQVTEAELAEARLILTTAIVSNYLRLQTNLALLDLTQQMLAQRKSTRGLVRIRTRRELESHIPENRSDIEVQNIELSLAQAKQAVQLSRHQLALLLGKNPWTTEISIKKFTDYPDIVLPTEIRANLLARRPDVLASCWRAEAAAHQINVAKSRFFPNINLSGFLSYQAIGLGRLFRGESRDDNIMGAIDLPLFDAGLRRAHLKTRFAEYDVAVNQYNATLLNALNEVADQFTILNSVKTQQRAQALVLRNTRRNYQLVQARYRRGIADYNEVLEMQGLLLNQQQIAIQLKAQRLLTLVAAIKALGGDYTMYVEGCG